MTACQKPGLAIGLLAAAVLLLLVLPVLVLDYLAEGCLFIAWQLRYGVRGTRALSRLTKSPVISIASIRGRTRGGGNEFSLACDLRYASIEKALFGQPEVGVGILPGGGGSERLPRLVGRDRALEIILSSQDYGADDAERFGMVTRALPDSELDPFVEALAARLSGFDKLSLAGAKAQVNRATLPADADFLAAYAEYSQSLAWPGFQARRPRVAKLVSEHGLADFELRMGHYLGLAN